MPDRHLAGCSQDQPDNAPRVIVAARNQAGERHYDGRHHSSAPDRITGNAAADGDPANIAGRGRSRMVPVTFGGCFGWLHPGAGGCGVVLCGPIGFEKQVFHRSLRVMADRLSEAGYPTLRFDYPGTGDAGGIDGTPNEQQGWLDGIEAATGWLSAHVGAKQVILCGVEVGALLAGVAAARMGGVNRLILIAPVTSGRVYTRTFRLAARLGAAQDAGRGVDGSGHIGDQETGQDLSEQSCRNSEHQSRNGNGEMPAQVVKEQTGKLMPAGLAEHAVEAYGLRLHTTTLRALALLDLARLDALAARDILLLDATGLDAVKALSAALVADGVRLTQLDMPDYLQMARQPHQSEVPIASFDRILAWLREADAPAALNVPDPGPVAAMLVSSTWTERPVVLDSRDGRTAGILCRPAELTGAPPAEAARREAVALLIVNTGANPHYGYGRFAVTLARALAGDGVMSLRLDLSGFGDSVLDDPDTSPHLFRDRSSDIAAGLAFLQSQGASACVGFGICSGAFQIFRAALSDLRMCGLVLVNQPSYRPPASMRMARVGSLRALRRRLRGRPAPAVGEALENMRLIPPVRKRARLQARMIGAVRVLEDALLRRVGLWTAVSFPRRSFERFATRGMKVLVVAGDDDPGHLLLQAHFGPKLLGLRRIAGHRVLIEPQFDHPVGDSGSQRRLLAATRAFLRDLKVGRAEPTSQAD